MSTLLLHVRDLELSYGSNIVFKNLNFDLYAGELFALIGPNGAGKTTLLRALIGQLLPSAGIITSKKGKELKSSYVGQSFELKPNLPVRAIDYVWLALSGNKIGLPFISKKQKAKIKWALNQTGALDLADRRLGHLSRGQLQRVLIAGAIVVEPDIVYLDEPFASLDIKSEHQIVKLVEQLRTELNTSFIVSTHDLNPLSGVVDKVIYVANGAALVGGVDEVINSEALSELYDEKVEVLTVSGKKLIVTSSVDRHLFH